MKKISYVLAALATIAIAAPAFAEDKPMMKEGIGEDMANRDRIAKAARATGSGKAICDGLGADRTSASFDRRASPASRAGGRRTR